MSLTEGTTKTTSKEKEKEVDVDIEIDLTPTRKKKLRIDGDNNKILELNVSDMGILSRLEESYPKLDKLAEKANKMSQNNDTSAEDFDESELAKQIKDIDNEMRQIMDELFNANVSEICASDGSMFDPFEGVCRYEYIIDALVKAYEGNIAEETKKLSKNVSKHTGKYTKKKGK